LLWHRFDEINVIKPKKDIAGLLIVGIVNSHKIKG